MACVLTIWSSRSCRHSKHSSTTASVSNRCTAQCLPLCCAARPVQRGLIWPNLLNVIHGAQDGAAGGPPGQGLEAQPSPLGLHLVQRILQRPFLQWHRQTTLETAIPQPGEHFKSQNEMHRGAHMQTQALARWQKYTHACLAGIPGSAAQYEPLADLACVLRHLLDGNDVCRQAQLQRAAQAEGCRTYVHTRHRLVS